MADTFKVTKRKVTDYLPDIANANAGSERGLQMIEDSLQQDGAGRSIVADKDGRLPAGNKTLEAAVNAGIEDVIEIETDGHALIVHKRRDWDLTDPLGAARRYAYRDNRASEVSLNWNVEQLLADVNAGVDLSHLWTENELDALLADLTPPIPVDDPGADVDRAEELREKWQTSLGQLWTIESKNAKGAHRLLCGDSTNAEDAARVMGGERAHLVMTSPPYWVGKDYEQETTWEEVQQFIERLCICLTLHCTHRIVINTGAPPVAHLTGERAHVRLLLDDYQRALYSHGWLMRYVRIWAKRGGLAHTAPQSDCIDQHWEFVGVFYDPKNYEGQRRLGEKWAIDGIWDDFQGEMSSHGHVAAYPVELPSRNIRLYTDKQHMVLDPFGGSGTTMVACEQLGRLCRMIELEPKYCAVILERMAGLGLAPRLVQ